MNVVVFGTGSIGKRHIKNLLSLDQQIRFIIVRSSGMHDIYSESLDSVICRNPEEVLKFSPSFVLICTPSSLHIEPILFAIRNNLPFFVEKPIVTSISHINKIKYLVQHCKYEKPVLVGCNLRYLTSLKLAKEIVLSGELGNIARATFEAGQWLPDWRPNADFLESYSSSVSMGGGVIFDLIHEIDMARFFFGDFTEVKAFSSSIPSLPIESESISSIILQNKTSCPIVTINIDYVSRVPLRRYAFIGDKANLVWNMRNNLLFLEGKDYYRVITNNPNDFDLSKTYMHAMSELLLLIRSNGESSITITDGLRTAELALSVKLAL